MEGLLHLLTGKRVNVVTTAQEVTGVLKKEGGHYFIITKNITGETTVKWYFNPLYVTSVEVDAMESVSLNGESVKV